MTCLKKPSTSIDGVVLEAKERPTAASRRSWRINSKKDLVGGGQSIKRIGGRSCWKSTNLFQNGVHLNKNKRRQPMHGRLVLGRQDTVFGDEVIVDREGYRNSTCSILSVNTAVFEQGTGLTFCEPDEGRTALRVCQGGVEGIEPPK